MNIVSSVICFLPKVVKLNLLKQAYLQKTES